MKNSNYEPKVYIGPPLKEQLELSEEILEKFRKTYPPGYAEEKVSAHPYNFASAKLKGTNKLKIKPEYEGTIDAKQD